MKSNHLIDNVELISTSPKLNKEQLQKIREKMNRQKKPRKLKGCNHPSCKFCQRYTQTANKYIQDFNDKLKENLRIQFSENKRFQLNESKDIQIQNKIDNIIIP